MNIALISETGVDTITGTSVYIEEISKNLAKIHNVFYFYHIGTIPNQKKISTVE